MNKVCVVVPNWNGEDSLKSCLDSLQGQTMQPHIIVVDNGSSDGSVELIKTNYPKIELIQHRENRGYSGGVNPGFRRAMELGSEYVAAFNNDAVADEEWLARLVEGLKEKTDAGIATCKMLSADGKHIDSTGEFYSVWGLPYPRGRSEPASSSYDSSYVFAASGGASLYRTKMLQEIGVFDEDFFAYYEDVDLSFRAQLAGWKVVYVADSVVRHAIGATSSKIHGFTTRQAMKNLPWLLLKNMPTKYLWPVFWRFSIAYSAFFVRAFIRGQGWWALRGGLKSLWLAPKKLVARHQIQKNRAVSESYIWEQLVHDLPPQADGLRALRAFGRKLVGRGSNA